MISPYINKQKMPKTDKANKRIDESLRNVNLVFVK